MEKLRKIENNYLQQKVDPEVPWENILMEAVRSESAICGQHEKYEAVPQRDCEPDKEQCMGFQEPRVHESRLLALAGPERGIAQAALLLQQLWLQLGWQQQGCRVRCIQPRRPNSPRPSVAI